MPWEKGQVKWNQQLVVILLRWSYITTGSINRVEYLSIAALVTLLFSYFYIVVDNIESYVSTVDRVQNVRAETSLPFFYREQHNTAN